MTKRTKRFDRRRFLAGLGAGVGAFHIIPRHVLGGEGKPAANDRLNIASIGVGGRGWADIKGVSSQNIVALCDVDQRKTGKAHKEFPAAKHYRDFRKMLDEMESGLNF